jgi:hypothetical protein
MNGIDKVIAAVESEVRALARNYAEPEVVGSVRVSSSTSIDSDAGGKRTVTVVVNVDLAEARRIQRING